MSGEFKRNGDLAFLGFAFAVILIAVNHWCSARNRWLAQACEDGSEIACAAIEELFDR